MKKYFLTLLVVILIGAVPKFNDLGSQGALNLLARYNWHAISFGHIPNVSNVVKFGYNKDIDSATPEDVWEAGGQFVIPAGAETLSIVSSSAQDGVAGTGARQLLISCLDEDYLMSMIFVTMNGTTPVVTTEQCAFINRISVYETGSTSSNVGNITVTQSTSGLTLGYVGAGNSVTNQAIFQVPADSNASISGFRITSVKTGGGSSPVVRIQLVVYNYTTETEYIIFEDVLDTSIELTREYGDMFKDQPLLPKEIVIPRITTDQNNTEVYIRGKTIIQKIQ